MRRAQDTQLHFVGIGGIGMSGIAEVFLNQGYQVSGSDLAESETTRRLGSLGVSIKIGHVAKNVRGAHVVVVSSAIRETNPEVLEAKRLRIPLIPRAEMLGELMRGKTGVAVAGTHGKTTTTSMLATILTHAGLDPTLVIGGKVDSLGGNAKLGQGKFIVVEADESDGSFLYLPATYGIVTNIDDDHLDHFGNIQAIENAFVDFVGKLPFYGCAVVCGENESVRRCLPRFTKPAVTYGMSNTWDFYCSDLVSTGMGSNWTVHARENSEAPHKKLGEVSVRVPGRHNVLNALGAIAVATAMDIPFAKIAEGLAQFSGVRRRFEIKHEDRTGRRLFVDDYGHHPTEIAATLAAARGMWNGRIITVFQPHRYTRTRLCHDGFLSAFAQTDCLLVTDIYAGGEDPIEGVHARDLTGAIAHALGKKSSDFRYTGSIAETKAAALKLISEGDLVLFLGAGSITRLADEVVAAVSAG